VPSSIYELCEQLKKNLVRYCNRVKVLKEHFNHHTRLFGGYVKVSVVRNHFRFFSNFLIQYLRFDLRILETHFELFLAVDKFDIIFLKFGMKTKRMLKIPYNTIFWLSLCRIKCVKSTLSRHTVTQPFSNNVDIMIGIKHKAPKMLQTYSRIFAFSRPLASSICLEIIKLLNINLLPQALIAFVHKQVSF
jgi:hypothetical protein